MNTILYKLILFTNLNFKFEIDQITKQSDITVMGQHKMCSRTLAGLRLTSGRLRIVYHCFVDFIQRTRAREGRKAVTVIRYAKTRRRLRELGDPNPNINSHPSPPSYTQPMRVLTIKSYFKLLAGRNEFNRGTA
jgi:hypothetical protein